jgi:glycosyltransferase involved in cell wall biosynthesis
VKPGAQRLDIVIVTSAHWEGDARLNRHLRFLREAGHSCQLVGRSDQPRVRAMISALRVITTTRAELVILPDPELFVLGSVAARLTGKRPLIDIHENYPKTAAERSWVPAPFRPIIAMAARLTVEVGRRLAWRVVVAAPELARSDDTLVSHAQNPADYLPNPGSPQPQLVYVGEVTPARGAFEMIEMLAQLDPRFDLVIVGKAVGETKTAIEAMALRLGVSDRVSLAGRLPHEEAWDKARHALAGLNLLRPVPAYREAVATKILEYMAAGLPPVVSDLPGQAALVSQIHPDLVCGDIEAAASIVQRLWEDPVLRQEIVDRGRELVSTMWAEQRPDLALQRAVSP